MGTAIVIVFLLLIMALAVKSIIHRIRHGSACCGERDAPEKKIHPKDKNKAHYPYKYIISVDGMHCSNCTRRVENSLNKIDGFWATASLENKTVTVLSKTEVAAGTFEKEIRDAGYTVLSVTKENKD